MSKTINPQALAQAAMGNRPKVENESAISNDEKKSTPATASTAAAASDKKIYQLCSAPASFHYPWNAVKTCYPDGVIRDYTDQEQEELEKAVAARCISYYAPGVVPERAKVPVPTTKIVERFEGLEQ